MTENEIFYGAPAYVFEFASKLRKTMTPAEKILWEELRSNKLTGAKFRRQHPIYNYIADFYCHKAKLVIEIDGVIHEKQKEYDISRDDDMNELGIKVIRFKNEEVMDNLGQVLKKIETEILKFTSP
jgi:very-short-patch-repair endonuclease